MTSYVNQNGFLLFVQDVKKAHGLSFDEAAHKAAIDWEDLPKDVQCQYNEKAISRISGKSKMVEKFNCDGVSLTQIALDQMEEVEHQQIMLLYIQEMLANLDYPEEFLQQKFLLCHVNYFYILNDKVFKPAEIALCEFHLKHGVLRTFHRFIDPGPIDLGYRSETKEMEKLHGISLDNHDIPFDTEPEQLSLQMLDFIKKDCRGKHRPLFTMPDQVTLNHCSSAVEDVVKQFTLASGKDNSNIKIFHLNTLLYHLLKRIDTKEKLDLEIKKEVNFQQCTTWLENDSFSHCKNLACDFHEENDLSACCSLSIVKRWAYTVCEHTLPFLNMELQRGWHIPGDARTKFIWRRNKTSHLNDNDSDKGENIGQTWSSHRGRSDKKNSHQRGRGGNHGKNDHTFNTHHQDKDLSNGNNLASQLKVFTIVDHSSGTVTKVGDAGEQSTSMQMTTKSAADKTGHTSGSGYAVALKGRAPPPTSSSFSEFPSLQNDVPKKTEFPPLGGGHIWRGRGKK